LKKIIEDAAKLLMYKGPAIHELIAEAVMENKVVKVERKESVTILTVNFITAYDTNITDVYVFNSEKELIKQEIQVNKKIKVVFDKYREVANLLRNIPNQDVLAS
jgi:formaldehyde-activating enzyme involved in methanogenesis